MRSYRNHQAANSNVSRLSSRPVWPLPVLNGRDPVVMGACRRGPGVALAYPRANAEDLVVAYPTTGLNGNATHFMPTRMPVFAVRDGEIAHIGGEVRSETILIDHGNGWATFYRNLECVFATVSPGRKNERVRAGDVLGHVGTGDAGFKSLDFELWKRNDEGEFEVVDPRGEMPRWLILPWTDARLTPDESIAKTIAA